jgi:hypothetical protein
VPPALLERPERLLKEIIGHLAELLPLRGLVLGDTEIGEGLWGRVVRPHNRGASAARVALGALVLLALFQQLPDLALRPQLDLAGLTFGLGIMRLGACASWLKVKTPAYERR